MISGIRDHVLALACLRHGVPAVQGRGMDKLPPAATAAIAGALVRSLAVSELAGARASRSQGRPGPGQADRGRTTEGGRPRGAVVADDEPGEIRFRSDVTV